MGALDKLNQVVAALQQHAATIGITTAGLMVAVYAIWIMLDNDQSPMHRTERWAKLRKLSDYWNGASRCWGMNPVFFKARLRLRSGAS